jgi:MFS family permease
MPVEEAHVPAIIAPNRLAAFKHWARRVTLASIFGNALFGIWAVAGPLDALGSAALATSLLLTAAGVTSVACAAAIPERRIGWLVPLIGILASVLGYALLIGAAWNDFMISILWRLGGSLVAAAVAVGYASLLSDVHLTGRYRRFLRMAYVLLMMLSVFLIAFLWGWVPGQGWRLFGILAVLLGAITIAAPVVERLRPDAGAIPDIAHCPYCGGVARGRGEKARCPACHRRFRVTEI